jgi:regulator of protease activity HflC (stomatin/prohibitin superfamily)
MIFNRQKKIALSTTIATFIASAILAIFALQKLVEGSTQLKHAILALCLAGVISLLAFFQASISNKAELEQRDLENRPPEDNIFGEADEQEFRGNQARSLHSFKKVITPISIILISGLEFAAGFYLINQEVSLDFKLTEEISSASLMYSFILGAFAFVAFASGKYLAGLSYGEKATLLRPTAGRLLYAAFVAFLAAAASLASSYGYFEWLNRLNTLLAILAFVLATERILLWVLDLYRPREAGATEAPVYESRFLSIFSRPSGFLSNLSDALEYQFGFRISEQILSSFCFKIFLPFIALQLLLLVTFSSLTYIQPGHTGIISGSDKTMVKQAGLYLTKPWPLTQVTRIETGKTHNLNFTLGKDLRSTEEIESDGPFLEDKAWSNPHYEASLFMTGGSANSPASLLVFNAELQYRISNKDSDVLAWASHDAPEDKLKFLSQKALMQLLLNNSFLTLYKRPLEELASELKREINGLLQQAGSPLGIEVSDLQILNFQPHPAIAAAWHEQLSAYEDQKRIQYEAETAAEVKSHEALAEESDILNQSQSDYLMKSQIAEADREIFQTRLNAYLKYGELYTQSEMIEALKKHLMGVRKIVFTKRQKKIATLDLKKPQPSILDISEE